MKQNSICLLMMLAGILATTSALKSIREFGAIPHNNSDEASWINSQAFAQAILAANSSQDERVAVVPEGDVYYLFYFESTNITNTTVRIDGTLILNDNRTAWPQNLPHRITSLYFNYSSNITIEGKGTVEGQGYWWWWHTILTAEDKRPSLLVLDYCTDIYIHQLTFKNSPMYHIYLEDVRNVVIRDLTITVDVIAQKQLLSDHGLLNEFGIPTFPLNTDGIDPAGENILIENVYIQCYDDAVAVKPLRRNSKNANCSRNMIIRNATVVYGVGMTIGSVPPNDDVNCVENILFQDIVFRYPFKAIYIKSNPGSHGTGIINNIVYKNIDINYALWYPIWIGPQQQQQPGSEGTGCSFFFPIVNTCPTQPRVQMSNIKLENVTLSGGLTLPGVIICNETTPCTGFNFTNVKNTGLFLVKRSYVVQNVQGVSIGSYPDPGFTTPTTDALEFNAAEPIEYSLPDRAFYDITEGDEGDDVVDYN